MARLRYLTGKLEDDRGVCHAQKPVHIKDRSSFRLQGWFRPSVPYGEGSDPCHLRAMLERQAIGRRAMENGPNRVLLGVIALIFVAGAAAVWSESRGIAILSLCMPGLALLVDATDRRRFRHRYERVRILPPACLACLYELSGLTTEPDGCTICPECGAAWRLSLATAEPPTNPP
ncbi:MAG: hypothetical protein IT431_08340 [Phycisphaerales bacterium]|nr:hypothetical protein [Phycisphaerales bacterium]